MGYGLRGLRQYEGKYVWTNDKAMELTKIRASEGVKDRSVRVQGGDDYLSNVARAASGQERESVWKARE